MDCPPEDSTGSQDVTMDCPPEDSTGSQDVTMDCPLEDSTDSPVKRPAEMLCDKLKPPGGQPSEQRGQVLCDVCLDDDVEEEAVKTCQTCSSSYCEKHLRRHKTTPDLQRHVLLEPSGGQLVPAPEKLKVEAVTSSTATMNWNLPNGTDQTQFQYQVSYQRPEMEEPIVQTIRTSRITLSGLHCDSEYNVSVCTVSQNHGNSQPVSMTFITKSSLKSWMENLGVGQHLLTKLSLNTTLALSGRTVDESKASTLQTLVPCFLRELMKVNAAARDVLCSFSVNPLDLIVSLFLCSDPFLQQEIALKMSMCQFAVPLLLPKCDTQGVTLMQWSLRGIVKTFRPHSMAEQRGFVENSIVLTDLPMVSFVRLGESSLSKSQLLNEVLSKPQQVNNTFVHQNMKGGNQSRKVSDGLVEMSWYLPCGKEIIDVFPEALAVANLRGDLQHFGTQFSFLQKTSAAMFVFCDDLATSEGLLSLPHQDKLFIVSNTEDKGYNAASFEKTQIPAGQMIKKDRQMNNAQLVEKLSSVISQVMSAKPYTCSVEKMSDVARSIGISVDEEACQVSRMEANSISAGISQTSRFKEEELPLQGKLLSDIAKLEREECKCKDVGQKSVEQYKGGLRKEKDDLRKQQLAQGQNGTVVKFIDDLRKYEGQQRSFYLKWLKMNLDNHSRKLVSHLRNQYKELCEASPDKKAMADLEAEISNASLGIEHFLREIGQLYESALTLPQDSATRQKVKDLPKICAKLMLDGFPLELMDGDASHIPIRWIEDVLKEIHSLTKSESKIRVITVLGVQSSGKSTLLNTMFGVQFAVSSGRCTRGAFMQLIRVEEDLKEKLGCSFIMVIDTEGLKAPELAQMADSYEHDNELATMVIGLSDVTIINIAMENAAEMKDVLQIVVHSFLRMKEVGKKPQCLFVHQNVPDVAANVKNASGRNVLVQQLDEMTGIAARMEKKEANTRFTDIMVYNPEQDSFYLPGLWHGTPPMAPVSTGYSEAVAVLKKSIIQKLADLKTPVSSILDFLEWTKSLWNAVKHENFIFSFRNCLEADAYNNLSQEFSKWDRDFRKDMESWWQVAEMEISNHGTVACSKRAPTLHDLKVYLRSECTASLDHQEKEIQEKVQKYFEKRENHVELVEKHKGSFVNSAKMLRTEMDNSLKNHLESAVEKRQNMKKIDDLKKTQSDQIEKQVVALLAACREKGLMTDKQLEEEFEKTWNCTVHSLSITGIEKRDVVQEMEQHLRISMKNRGPVEMELLNNVSFSTSGAQFETPTGDKAKGMKGQLSNMCKYVWGRFTGNDSENQAKFEREQMAANIIQKCEHFVEEKVGQASDYQARYTTDLLKIIDEDLKRSKKISAEFETQLKIEIFIKAMGKFQCLHNRFLEDNDPQKCLEKYKSRYLADLMDQYKQADQCERKAEEFTEHLKMAVKEYVNRRLWPAIEHKLMESKQGSNLKTRTFFQYAILQQLLEDDKIEQFVDYAGNYEAFVKAWIDQEIEKFASQDKHIIAHLEVEILIKITAKVQEAISSSEVENRDVCSLISAICKKLNKELVISYELNAGLPWNTDKIGKFSTHLKQCISQMEKSLEDGFYTDTDVKKKLANLELKSQTIFKSLVGCGHQCPFCKAPCEAAEQGHTEHFTVLHRPEGIGRYSWKDSKKLVSDICSSLVASETAAFRNEDTKQQFHPNKEYKKIYPDWRIQPDPSVEASDYWKYVFVKHNEGFAKKYNAKPADLPPGWEDITKEQAREGLAKMYRL